MLFVLFFLVLSEERLILVLSLPSFPIFLAVGGCSRRNCEGIAILLDLLLKALMVISDVNGNYLRDIDIFETVRIRPVTHIIINFFDRILRFLWRWTTLSFAWFLSVCMLDVLILLLLVLLLYFTVAAILHGFSST